MAFDFLCPNGHVLQADESASGQPCNCPHCGAAFLIPQPTAAPQQGMGPAGGMPQNQMPGYTPQNQMPLQQNPPMQQMPQQPQQQVPQQPQQQPYAQQQPPMEQPYQAEPQGMDPGLAQVGQVSLDHLQYGEDAPPADQEYYEEEYAEEGEYEEGEYEEGEYEEESYVDTSSGLRAMGGGSEQMLHLPCPKGHWLEASRDMVGGYATCPYCNETFLVSYEHSREGQREKKLREKAREEKIASNWLTWSIVIAVSVVCLIFGMIAAR